MREQESQSSVIELADEICLSNRRTDDFRDISQSRRADVDGPPDVRASRPNRNEGEVMGVVERLTKGPLKDEAKHGHGEYDVLCLDAGQRGSAQVYDGLTVIRVTVYC